MQFLRCLIAGACVAAFPLTASAQDPPDVQVQQTTTTTTMNIGDTSSHWLASGFVGTSFGRDAEEAGFDFGGSLGYLWGGAAGVELQANFSPDFNLEGGRSALLLGEQPWINSYMFNAIGAVPIGDEGSWRPYVSGGLGALTLQSDALIDSGDFHNITPDDTRAAGNIGFGVMGFGGNTGFRADVRYFRGFRDDDLAGEVDDPAQFIGSQVLSELAFWRANVGLAFRF